MSAPRGSLRVLPALALLMTAGCGAHAQRQAVQPRLSAPLAAELSRESTAIATLLDAGNSCAALRGAERLQRHTIAAINHGRVPGALQEPLQSTVNDLAARVRCVPGAPVAPATPQSAAEEARNLSAWVRRYSAGSTK